MREIRVRFTNGLASARIADAAHARPDLPGTGAGGPDAAGDASAREAADGRDRDRIEAAFQAIDERLQEIESRRQEALTEMQQAAVELAVAVASRLVHHSIQVGDYAVEELVGSLIARCDARGPVTIRLNPADLELMQRRAGSSQLPGADHKACTIVADASLERGDCRVDAGDYGILAKLELQLAELRQHLLECLEDAQIERRRPQTGNRDLRRYPDRRETA